MVVFVAVSTMVAFAFVVPLGVLVRRTAEDRAIDAALADASAVVPTLVAGGSPAQIEAAIGATAAGRQGRLTVITVDGQVIGPDTDSAPFLEAKEGGPSVIATGGSGSEVITSVAVGSDSYAAVRVFVPTSELRRGQWRAWLTLAAVGLALVGISVMIADRLARTIVGPAQDLARAARRLGSGELDVHIDPAGPPELQAAAGAFNDLGTRVSQMLDNERQLVAELSHRLRTPLTKLRLRLDDVDDAELAAALASDADDLTRVVNELIAEARGSLGAATGGAVAPTPNTGSFPDSLPASGPGSGISPTCDAGVVVAERAEFWRVLADDQGRPWRLEWAGGGTLVVAASAPDLAAALDVLLDNVFAHTPEGAALTIGVHRGDGEAVIRVEDGGSGLDPASVAVGASGSGSTGLGLGIARRTAVGAGGRLDLGSSPLGGASVSMVLPIVGARS